MSHKNYKLHQLNKKDMQQYRAASGLCVACGKLSQTYRCKQCAIKHNAAQKTYKLGLKEKVMAEKIGIVEVEATVIAINQIRLKYYGLPDDCGPDLIMDEDMARQTIAQLSKCLPENNKKDKVT
jgi:hypothetical protein